MNRKFSKLLLIWISINACFLSVFPFYIMLVNSFKTKKELFTSTLALPEIWQLRNYQEAFAALDFKTTLVNSLIITIGSTLAILFFGSLAGYALQRTKTKTSKLLFFVFLSAILVPFQSVMIPLVMFTSKLHLINTQIGMIFVYLGFGCSMNVFLVHGALNNIPISMDEAAIIDGAGRFTVFFRIMIPLLKPILITSAVLNVLWIWNDYLLPSLIINRADLHTIPLRLYYFFAEYTKQWNLAMAGLVLALIPVIVFYIFAQKYIIQGITDGAVK